MNDGSATKITQPLQSPSKIDITIVTPDIANKLLWKVILDSLGSDHYLINMEYDIKYITDSRILYLKWKEATANWDLFQIHLNIEIRTHREANTIDNTLIQFANILDKVSSATMKEKGNIGNE